MSKLVYRMRSVDALLDKYKELENSRKSKVVIIMLTTSLNPDDRMKASQIPEISGFENKPLTPELIDRVLNKYFYNKTSAVELAC